MTLRSDDSQAYSRRQHAGKRAAALTRQLLTFGRKQAFQLQPIDLNTLISDIGGMLTSILGEHLELQTNLAACDTTIKADEAEIEQMFLNLAANGRDAMPAGGVLTISTARESFFSA